MLQESDREYEGEGDEGGKGRLPLYAYPAQRQRWGVEQVLPYINWGDLFFDLFYVAAAYNLGTLLMSALTPELWRRGVLYFLAAFGSMYNMWDAKLGYEARFAVSDFAHEALEVVRVFFLGISVLHIKSIDRMSDPSSIETFGFTIGLFLESFVHILLLVELTFYGVGDREAIKNHGLTRITTVYLPQTVLYFVASSFAASQYWKVTDEGNILSGDCDHRILGGGATINHTSESMGDCARNLGREVVATSDFGWKLQDLPLTICLVSYLLHIATESFLMAFVLPKLIDFRKRNVPINIDYCIHRYGEWTMLMLGEAVLSLLIVDTTESQQYYIVTTLGVLTVIILQTVKYESEPSHAAGHALWRSLSAGHFYGVLIHILSMGLIAFGVSYKVMLKTIFKKSTKDSEVYGYQSTLSDATDYGYGNSDAYDIQKLHGQEGHRLLSGSVSVDIGASSALFCGSLTIILVALEALMNCHCGADENFSSIFKRDTNQLRVLDLIFKIFVILFTATLSLWVETPVKVAVAGFFIVSSIAISRIYWYNVTFHPEKCKLKLPSIQHLAIFQAAIDESQWETALDAFQIYRSDFKAGTMHAKAIDLFSRIDVDADGYLDPDEFRIALRDMDVVLSSHRVASMFKKVDDNGDGVLTLQEFMNFLNDKMSKKQSVLTSAAGKYAGRNCC